MVWSHCFQSGNSSKDSLAKMSQNSWYGLGTMSSKRVDEVPPAASASFWEMVWVALISSDRTPTNQMRSRSPSSSSSGSGHAIQVRARLPCEWIQTLEPPLHVLADGDGSSVASESYRPICGSADSSPL